jgi:hypothetical protein
MNTNDLIDTLNTPRDPAGDVLDASTIATTGVVIKDRLGNTFAIPDEAMVDYATLGAGDPLATLPYETEFHYQVIRADQLPQYIGNGWVLVTNRELGRPAAIINREFGAATDDNFRIGPDYMVKRPKVLHVRAMKAHEIKTLESLVALEPSETAVDAARQAGFASNYESKMSLLDRVRSAKVE